MPNTHLPAPFEQFFSHSQIVDFGRSRIGLNFNSRPAYPKIPLESIENLLDRYVVSESRGLGQTSAAVGAGEPAHRDGELSIKEMVGSEAMCFKRYRRSVSLTAQGSAVWRAKVVRCIRQRAGTTLHSHGESTRRGGFVGIYAQELSYGLDSQDLGVAEGGRRTALAQRSFTARFKPSVDKATRQRR